MSAQYHSRRIIADAIVAAWGLIGAIADKLHALEIKAVTWSENADRKAVEAAFTAKQALIEKHTGVLQGAGDVHEAALRQARRLEEAAEALRKTSANEFNIAIDAFGAAVDKAHEFLDNAIEYHQ